MSGTVCVAIGMGGQTGSWPCLSTDSVSLLSQRLVLVLALLLPRENPLHVSLPHVKQGSSPGAPWGWAPAALSPSSLEETLERQIPSLGLRSCYSNPVSSPAPMCSHRLAVDVCTGLFEPRSSPLLTAKCWQPPLRVQQCSASGAPLLPPEGCCSTCSPGTVDTRCLLLKTASGKGRGKMFYICPGPKRSLVGSGYI